MTVKESQDWKHNRILRLGATGLTGGAGLASALNLLHELKRIRERKKRYKEPSSSDRNTIVLTIPSKAAEITASDSEPSKVKSVTRASSTSKMVPAGEYRAGYYPNQAMKVAELPGWLEYALSGLALGGGSVAGWRIADALYQTNVKRKLKKEEEAAKRHMLKALESNSLKTASFVDEIIDVDSFTQFDKQARSRWDALLGIPTLLTLLGTGGTAYLTKRLLDAQKEDEEGEGLDAPAPPRIIFKSVPASKPEPGEKQASVNDLHALQACVIVMMDKMAGQSRVMSDPSMQDMMKQAGTSANQLYKKADNIDELLAYIQDRPELLSKIRDLGIDKFKGLRQIGWGEHKLNIPASAVKWVAGLPGVSGHANEKMLSGIEKYLRSDNKTPPKYEGLDLKDLLGKLWGGVSRFAKGLGRKFLNYGGGTPAPKQQVAGVPGYDPRVVGTSVFSPRYEGAPTPPTGALTHSQKVGGSVKESGLTMPVLHSFLGSTFAQRADKDVAKDIAYRVRHIGTREDKDKDKDKDKDEDKLKRVSNIKLEAEGPEAKHFLYKNRRKIRKVLEDMAAQGTI